MAKQHGIIKINGKLGDMSFQKAAGKWIVKEIDPSLSERVKTSPNYLNTRLNGRDFGNCMAVAKDIYDAILGKRQTMYLRTNYPLGRLQKALLARMRDHEEELGFRGITGLDMEAVIPQINALAKRPFESTFFTPQIYVSSTAMVLAPIDYSQARAAAQAVGADFLKVEVSRTKTIGGIAVDSAGEAHRTWEVAPGAFNIHTSNTRLWPNPVVDEDSELTWEDPQAIQNNIFGEVEYDLTKGAYYEIKVIPCKIESIGSGRYTYSELLSDASFIVLGAIPEAEELTIKMGTIPAIPSEYAGSKYIVQQSFKEIPDMLYDYFDEPEQAQEFISTLNDPALNYFGLYLGTEGASAPTLNAAARMRVNDQTTVKGSVTTNIPYMEVKALEFVDY